MRLFGPFYKLSALRPHSWVGINERGRLPIATAIGIYNSSKLSEAALWVTA
jgi:hypothetical protein